MRVIVQGPRSQKASATGWTAMSGCTSCTAAA